MVGDIVLPVLLVLTKDKKKKDGGASAEASPEASPDTSPSPDPSVSPSPDPSSDPSGDSSGGDAIGSVIDFLFANPVVILVIAGIIGVVYGWQQLRRYNAERGKATPPLGFIIKRSLKFAFKEDRAPVFKRIPGFGWFRWTYMYLILVFGTIFLYLMGLHDLLIGSAVLALIIWWRARKVFAIRHGILMQMFNVAAADFRYPKGAELNPWGYVNVTQWIDMYRPGQTVITFPAGFKSEDLTARERFERNFSGSVSDENSFTYEWKSAQNRVIASPTPYLPATAKYPGLDDHPWNEFPLGITWGGQEAVIDVSVTPHTLVAGPTGSGKSVLQRTILMHALQHPDWRVIGIDPKMVELGPYKHHKNVLKIATQLEESAALLESAENEMKRRYEEMTQHGVNHFKDLPPDPENGQPLPALLVMVDETYALLAPEGIKSDEGKERDALHARCTVLIGSIARLGRAAGVHLVLATQRPDAKVLPGETRNNLDARIACGRMDTTPSLMVLDSDHATRLPLIKGRSVLRLGGEVKEYQGYFLPIEDVDAVVTAGLERNLAKIRNPHADSASGMDPSGHSAHEGHGDHGSAPAHDVAPTGGGIKGWWARRAAAARAVDESLPQTGTISKRQPTPTEDFPVGADAAAPHSHVSSGLARDIETARWSSDGAGWDGEEVSLPDDFPLPDTSGPGHAANVRADEDHGSLAGSEPVSGTVDNATQESIEDLHRQLMMELMEEDEDPGPADLESPPSTVTVPVEEPPLPESRPVSDPVPATPPQTRAPQPPVPVPPRGPRPPAPQSPARPPVPPRGPRPPAPQSPARPPGSSGKQWPPKPPAGGLPTAPPKR